MAGRDTEYRPAAGSPEHTPSGQLGLKGRRAPAGARFKNARAPNTYAHTLDDGGALVSTLRVLRAAYALVTVRDDDNNSSGHKSGPREKRERVLLAVHGRSTLLVSL